VALRKASINTVASKLFLSNFSGHTSYHIVPVYSVFFSAAPKLVHVSSLISFRSPGPPERSEIVIFDLPDQSFNTRSKGEGLLCVFVC
jgi:hypothetical protein